MTTQSLKSQKGFSLIELAVVLVIIGILVGSFLGTLGARIENTRRADAQVQLEEIKTVLYGYAVSQTPPRLPCPDTDNDGLEDAPCAAATTIGNLPWTTLGIDRLDPWSSTWSYWVAGPYSVGFTLTTSAAGTGQIDRTTTAASMISNNVAAVVMSHGRNQYGAIDLNNQAMPAVPAGAAYDDERENVDTDAVAPVLFISRVVTGETSPQVYDDMIVWISEFELKGKMIQAGKLP